MSDVNLTVTQNVVKVIHTAKQGVAGPPGPAAQGLTVDQTAAINGANAPSAGNVFATVNDIPAAPDLSGKADKQSGVILGQKDAAPLFTLTDAIQTVALDYNAGNGATIDASVVTGGKAITLTMANFPASSGGRGDYCLTIKTGAAIPAFVAPAGWVVGTLFSGIAASKTSEFYVRSVGTGAPRMSLFEAY